MSDVEKMYYSVQKALGQSGVRWEQLLPMQQIQFTQAVNVILQLCTTNVVYKEKDVV